jgi:NADPH-dependent 7-cyano-7-deazaguanine reductase QueF
MFDADVQITYKPLGKNQNELSKLIIDSRNFVNKHQVKASGIEEGIIDLMSPPYQNFRLVSIFLRPE